MVIKHCLRVSPTLRICVHCTSSSYCSTFSSSAYIYVHKTPIIGGEPEWAPHWLWQWPMCEENLFVSAVCVYNYYSPAFVAHWFLRSVYALKCSMYSGILTCSHVWFTTAYNLRLHSTEQQGWLELLVVCHEDWQVDGVYEFSLLRQWSCSYPATCQRACVIQKRPMGWLYYCFVMIILTEVWHWTYYSACVLLWM